MSQLQSRCGELTERVRRLEDGERGLQEVGACVCGGRPPADPAPSVPFVRQQTRPPQVPPLHALLRGNFMVEGSSEGWQSQGQKEGALGEAGVLQEDDGEVNLDEIPVGNDIWALMDQSVRMRIEQWVTEQGRAFKDYGPLSELARSVDGGSHSRSSARYSLSHAPSATDYGSVNFGQYGEDEGLLSLCDDESSSDSDDENTEFLSGSWDPAGIEADWAPAHAEGCEDQVRREWERRSAGRCNGGDTRNSEHSAGEPNAPPESTDRWNIDAQDDEWRPANGADAECSQKEMLRMQRRAAQRRIRLRSSVETGPVFASQTLFGRMMCGMQDRGPGVLQDALTPDLPF